MRLAELVGEYERRRLEAQRHGATAPLATVYALVLEELRDVDGVETPEGLVTTAAAARILGVARKTVAKWCAEGRFPGARKTSEQGEWRIPATAVYGTAGLAAKGGRRPVLKLWEEGQHG